MINLSRNGHARRVAVFLIAAFLIGAAFLRFIALERAPFRADELNMHMAVERGQSLVELWRDPPWKNQIPSAETLSMVSKSGTVRTS